jgi:hypothetical protein
MADLTVEELRAAYAAFRQARRAYRTARAAREASASETKLLEVAEAQALTAFEQAKRDMQSKLEAE